MMFIFVFVFSRARIGVLPKVRIWSSIVSQRSLYDKVMLNHVSSI